MDSSWSDEVHRSRRAAELVVAHTEIYLTKQNLPVPKSNAAKSGGPIQSLLLLGGLGAFAVLKLVPKSQPALKQFIQDHPIMWSPLNVLFSGGGAKSLGGSSQGQSQPKAPRGGREAASKAAKAAAQAAAARAAAAAPAPVKISPSASSSSKTVNSPSKIPAPQATSSTKPTPKPTSKPTQPVQSSPSKPAQPPPKTTTTSTLKKPSGTAKKR